MAPEIHGHIMKICSREKRKRRGSACQLPPLPYPSAHSPTLWKKRNESVKGVGIVQPAMQAENWRVLLGAPDFDSNVAPRHSQLQL